MSVVFVLGAGASYGERFGELTQPPGAPKVNTARPPLLDGFFQNALYDSIGYPRETAEKDFAPAFQYIRSRWLLAGPPNEDPWKDVNIEDVFTSIELDREFAGLESDVGAQLTLARNKLVRYIQRIVGFCTDGKYGEYSKRLVSAISVEEGSSLITFNWDLLVDQELTKRNGVGVFDLSPLYKSFLAAVLGYEVGPFFVGPQEPTPMFLKMHGSLNWFHCTNLKCPGSSTIEPKLDIQACLYLGEGIGEKKCNRCGSEMIPWLIPPVLRKPIAENWMSRAIWGLAKVRLQAATKAVIIGFSAAPTDFYASWLLRSTLGIRKNVQVFVVNPENGEADFDKRMRNIFPYGYIRDFQKFEEIDAIIERLRQKVPPARAGRAVRSQQPGGTHGVGIDGEPGSPAFNPMKS
jgi:hypothetical protein